MKESFERHEKRIRHRREREESNLFSRLPATYSASRAQGQKLLAKGGGLSIVEWRTLWDLYEIGPASIRDLAAIQRADHSLLSRALPDMKRKGYVVTHRDPEDGRQMLVELTDVGRAAYEKAAPIMRKRREAMRALYTSEEITAFVDYLDRLESFLRSPIEEFLAEETTK